MGAIIRHSEFLRTLGVVVSVVASADSRGIRLAYAFISTTELEAERKFSDVAPILASQFINLPARS